MTTTASVGEPGGTSTASPSTGFIIHADPVPLRLDDTGTVRVAGTRITLDLVAHQLRQGLTPEAIVRSYEGLELADIYFVAGYCLRHQPDVDAYLARREEEALELRSRAEALGLTSPPGFRERLRERRQQVQGERTSAETGNGR